MVTLTEEQVELLKKLSESLTKDKTFGEYIRGFFVSDQEEPTPSQVLNCAERYILTQHGLTHGSFGGEVGFLEVTISYKVKQEKTTT